MLGLNAPPPTASRAAGYRHQFTVAGGGQRYPLLPPLNITDETSAEAVSALIRPPHLAGRLTFIFALKTPGAWGRPP